MSYDTTNFVYRYPIAALAALLAVAFCCQSSLASFPKSIGSGVLATEERESDHFHKIRVSGAVLAKVNYGDDYSISITADDNLIPLVETSVRKNGTLVVQTALGKVIQSRNPILVTVTTPQMTGAKALEACDVEIEGFDLEEFSADVEGASQMTLGSKVEHLDLTVDGASRMLAADTSARTIEFKVSGTSLVTLAASESIEGRVSGASQVTYGGTASDISIKKMGTSTVQKAVAGDL